MNEERDRGTKMVGVGVLVPAILWQVYLVALLFRAAPAMEELVGDLGAELPAITRLFVGLYRWSFVVPLVSAAIAFDLLRRRNPSPQYTGVVVAIAIGLGFLLHAWATEAWFRPMFRLMEAVG